MYSTVHVEPNVADNDSHHVIACVFFVPACSCEYVVNVLLTVFLESVVALRPRGHDVTDQRSGSD